jgi:hypothetical protein
MIDWGVDNRRKYVRPCPALDLKALTAPRKAMPACLAGQPALGLSVGDGRSVVLTERCGVVWCGVQVGDQQCGVQRQRPEHWWQAQVRGEYNNKTARLAWPGLAS